MPPVHPEIARPEIYKAATKNAQILQITDKFAVIHLATGRVHNALHRVLQQKVNKNKYTKQYSCDTTYGPSIHKSGIKSQCRKTILQ